MSSHQRTSSQQSQHLLMVFQKRKGKRERRKMEGRARESRRHRSSRWLDLRVWHPRQL
jgi:hypothetical protein